MRVIVALDLDYFYAQVHEVELLKQDQQHWIDTNPHHGGQNVVVHPLAVNSIPLTKQNVLKVGNSTLDQTDVGANDDSTRIVRTNFITPKPTTLFEDIGSRELNKVRPIGVKQKHIIVTANYAARARGVSKLQLFTDAMKCCPELVAIDGSDLTRYRGKSADVESTVKRTLKQLVADSLTATTVVPGNVTDSENMQKSSIKVFQETVSDGTATGNFERIRREESAHDLERGNLQMARDENQNSMADISTTPISNGENGTGWREEQRAQIKRNPYMSRGCINAKYKNTDMSLTAQKTSGMMKGINKAKPAPKKHTSVKTPLQKSGMDEWFCDVTGLVNNIMQTPTHILYRQACQLEEKDINVVLGKPQQVPLHLRVGLCIAKTLQVAVLKETELTCSMGVGTSKLGVKIAVNHQKPHGSSVFVPENSRAYMTDKCVRIIPGCGSRYTNKIRQHLYDLGFHHGDGKKPDMEPLSDPEFEGSDNDNDGYGEFDNYTQSSGSNPGSNDTSPDKMVVRNTDESPKKVRLSATERQRERQRDRVISTKKSSFPRCFQVLDAFLKPETYARVLGPQSKTISHDESTTHNHADDSVLSAIGAADRRIAANPSKINPISITIEESLSATMSTKDVIANLDLVQMASVMHAKYEVAKTIALKCLGVCSDPIKESGLCTIISAEDSMQKKTFKTKLEVRAKMLCMVDNLMRRVWLDIAVNKRLPSTLYVRYRNSGLEESNKVNHCYQSRQTTFPHTDFGSLQRMLKIAELVTVQEDTDTNKPDHHGPLVLTGSERSIVDQAADPQGNADKQKNTERTQEVVEGTGSSSYPTRDKKSSEEKELRKQCEHLRFVILREAMSMMMRFSLNAYDPDTLTLLGIGVTGFSEPRSSIAEQSMDAYLVEETDKANRPAEACCPVCGQSFVGMLNSDMHAHLDKCTGTGDGVEGESGPTGVADRQAKGKLGANDDSMDGFKRKASTLFDFAANGGSKKGTVHSGASGRGKRKRGK